MKVKSKLYYNLRTSLVCSDSVGTREIQTPWKIKEVPITTISPNRMLRHGPHLFIVAHDIVNRRFSSSSCFRQSVMRPTIITSFLHSLTYFLLLAQLLPPILFAASAP